MRNHWTARRAVAALFSWGGALPIAFALLAVPTGCSRPHAPAVARHEEPAAPLDTLIEGIAPHLNEWIALWRYADHVAAVGSFRRVSEEPFTLHDIHRYDMKSWEEARRRRLFAVFAPDSTRFIDPDTRFDVALDERTIELTRGADSSPALVDLKTHSMSTLETSWRTGDCDGAFWLGNERFAITGTGAGTDTTGSRYGFVRAYDLNAGSVVEYQTSRVELRTFQSFRAARDSARSVRYRKLRL